MSEHVKILIVDDDELNLRILQEILEGSEFLAISAEDGEEALAQLETHPDIRVILLDRMMPKMDGMQFMEEFHKHDEWRHIAVVMQTAASEPRDVIEGNATGIYYYLTKPYDEQIVLSVVRAALDDQKKG